MKNLKSKIAIAILSGCIAAGSTVTSFAAEAEASAQDTVQTETAVSVPEDDYHAQRPMTTEEPPIFDQSYTMKEAERLSNDFGVARSDVVEYLQKGVHPRELHHASMVAKISGKSLKDVMTIKEGRHWNEVEQTLGVSREDLKGLMRELMAKRVAEDAHSDVNTVAKLLKNNYNPRDIEIAGIIAYESGKSIQSILNKKTINKGWWDVAKECGVTYDQVVANHTGHNHMTFNEHRHGGHSNMSRHHGGPRK